MSSRILRLALFAAIAVALYALNRSGAFEAALVAIQSLGPWAAPAFLALHVLSVPAFVPSLLPTFAAGVIFGVKGGLPLTVVGAAVGAGLAFALGRTAARGWVERRFAHEPRFEALSKLVRERGWKIVALARLTPIFPFSIANYAFGVTKMKGWQYVLATALGTIPSNAVYVYLGAVAGSVAAAGAEGRERSPLEWTLLIVGGIAAIGLAVYLRRVAQEALADASSS